MKLKIGDTEGEYKHLDPVRPPDAKDKLVMKLEATVEVNPQPLRVMRSFGHMAGDISGLLRPEAQIVLHSLFECFTKHQEVKEGLVGDLMWGFEQCGIPVKLTIVGLTALESAGYVKFQTPDNQFVGFDSDQIGSCWLRYQPKLLDMVYEGAAR